MKSLILTSPPRWRRLEDSPRTGANELRSWLLEPGSLTQRLRERYGNAFHVQLLKEHPGSPFQEEILTLGIRPGQKVLIREVGLMAGTSPVIMARSIIPQDTVKYADPRLARLENRPLGELLFAHRELARSRLQWSSIPLRRRWSFGKVMGRRSVYTLGPDFPVLVAEFFLPALLNPEP